MKSQLAFIVLSVLPVHLSFSAASPAALQSADSGVPREKTPFPLEFVVSVNPVLSVVGARHDLIITVTNAGRVSVDLERPWLANLELRVTRDGVECASLIKKTDVIDGGYPYTRIRPSETVRFTADLMNWFDFALPGTYEVRGRYSTAPVVSDSGRMLIFPNTRCDISISFKVEKG